jgi:hypothetical protein
MLSSFSSRRYLPGPVRGQLYCGLRHNSLVRLVLCSEKKQIRPSSPVLSCRHVVEWANASALFTHDGDDTVGLSPPYLLLFTPSVEPKWAVLLVIVVHTAVVYPGSHWGFINHGQVVWLEIAFFHVLVLAVFDAREVLPSMIFEDVQVAWMVVRVMIMAGEPLSESDAESCSELKIAAQHFLPFPTTCLWISYETECAMRDDVLYQELLLARWQPTITPKLLDETYAGHGEFFFFFFLEK